MPTSGFDRRYPTIPLDMKLPRCISTAIAGTLGVAAVAVPIFAAPAARAGSPANGDTLFRAYCATCHVSGPSRIEPTLAAGSNASVIVAAIGRIDAMKPLHGTLDADDLDDIASYLADRAGTKAPSTVNVVEYHHAWFDHYFITAVPVEIAKLDAGTIDGWVRTGREFKAYTQAAVGLSPVCRFFSKSFGAKSSHFYTPSTSECLVVKANPNWKFEGTVFHVAVPDIDGRCPVRTTPVYRLYNNSRGGAPNHRLTTDSAVRTQMRGQGWVPEGRDALGVSMCVPQ